MITKETIIKKSKELLDEVIAHRRHLHAHPEISQNEKETRAYICSVLESYNISYKLFKNHYGVLADIKAKNASKKVVALRADTDALPIKELNDVPYKSKYEGIMHACGHDAHSASLLGVAKILNDLRDNFEGTVRLLFQPSEEKYPGGALLMLNDGVLKNPDVNVIFAQHVLPTLETGKVGVKSGYAMASTDEVFITVKGKGGHGATPELNIDPVVIGAQIIVQLQQIVSRKAPPQIPTVLSFGRFIADGKTNIIPDTAHLEGTVRTFNEEWRLQIHTLINKICTTTAEAMGAHCEVRIDKGYPFLINNDLLTDRFKEYATAYLGKDNVSDIDLRMTAEDFAYYSQVIPSCFYRLGIRNAEKGIVSNIHSATFDIDEKALETGVGLMCWVALKELE